MTRSIVVLISHFHISKNGNSLTTGGKKNYENNCNWLIWDIRYDVVSSSMQFSVQWSLLECWLFRRRQAENRTEVCRGRNRKSWMRCGGRYKFTVSNHKRTKPNWAAGGVVQKLMGRTPETQPLMEETCTAIQHRLLPCSALGWAPKCCSCLAPQDSVLCWREGNNLMAVLFFTATLSGCISSNLLSITRG